MIEFAFVVIVGIAIGILFSYFYFRSKTKLLARELGDQIGQQIFDRKKTDLDSMFEEKYMGVLEKWKVEWEKKFREDALTRSRAVLKGAIAEQLAPMFEVFGYNPSDARFIGDPVDYVIFDGYTKVKERIEDIPITVVLADVKTGKAELSYEQRRIRKGIQKGLVKFETIRM